MPDATPKPCLVCGRDCSGQPRMKDAQGRYMHRACADKAKKLEGSARAGSISPGPAEAAPRKKSTRSRAAAPSGGVMDVLVAEALAEAPVPCEYCTKPRPRNAVVCVHCGYNTQTGRAAKTRVEKVRAPSKFGAGLAAASSSEGAAMGPLFWIVGGVIGGAIGAAIWATLVHQLQVEMKWIALLTGLLAGAGVFMGTRGEGGLVPGIVAVVIAVASICAGKYVGVSMLVEDAVKEVEFEPESFRADDITDDDLLQSLSDRIVGERIEAGRPIDWPEGLIELIQEMHVDEDGEPLPFESLDHGSRSEIAVRYSVWPDDYPEDLRRETRDRLAALTPQDKRDLQRQVAAELTEGSREFTEFVTETAKAAGFFATFGLRDVMYFLGAIVAAFFIGGKGGMD